VLNKKSKFLLIFFFLSFSVYTEEYGLASWYGGGEPLNYFTANGEVFSPYKFTCATRDYPFGTLLRVVNVRNGKSVIVRVNDRGPAWWLPSRIIDLTKAAFEQIEDLDKGLTFVRVEVIGKDEVREIEEAKKEAELKSDFLKEMRDIVKQEINQIFVEVENAKKQAKKGEG